MLRKSSLYILLAGFLALYLLDPFVKLSQKNFLPSDLFFLASVFFLFVSEFGFRRFMKELFGNPGIGPFYVFLLASLLGFLLNAMQRPVNESYYFFSALQLVFNFVLLYPLVQAHKDDIRKSRKLWAVHLWLIPFAGLLSVTDYVGLTSFGQDVGDRHFNVLLVSNGFWLFAVASPFLLQKLFPFRLASFGYSALWGLACAGMMLAGTKSALVVVALSIPFIVWLNRHRIFRDRRMFAGFVLFLVVTVAAGLMLQTFSVVSDRLQETQDFILTGRSDYSVANRLGQVQTVLDDWRRDPLGLLGRGFKQYTIIHPDDLDESVHNIYLQQLYDAGIVGLIAFLVMFHRYISRSAEAYRFARDRSDADAACYWACCIFVIASYLILGLAGQIGFYRHFWLPLFLATPSLREYSDFREAGHVPSNRHNPHRPEEMTRPKYLGLGPT